MRGFTRHPLWMRVQRKLERALARRGLELAPITTELPGPYRENSPVVPRKLSEYVAEAGTNGEIESPEALVLNKAVARFIGSAQSIVNVGSVSAAFERFVAVDRRLELVANVRDESFAKWAGGASMHENVSYCPGELSTLLELNERFDLALAIGVIDGRQDYSGFLRGLAQLADRVIVTASNKARDRQSLMAPRPTDCERIREWTTGEFYWVLKSHFDVVELYAMPDPVVPRTVGIGLLSEMSPVIAVCERS
jgi:hypothetical protein